MIIYIALIAVIVFCVLALDWSLRHADKRGVKTRREETMVEEKQRRRRDE